MIGWILFGLCYCAAGFLLICIFIAVRGNNKLTVMDVLKAVLWPLTLICSTVFVRK